MKHIPVSLGSNSYQVIVGQTLSELHSLCAIDAGIIIGDEKLRSQTEDAKLNLPTVLVDGGEALKSFGGLELLYRAFMNLNLDRAATVIAVGGGALTDAVGFAASTYNRGMPLITVPTTLLAQVDASIGGKNAINFGGVKNIVGTIVQPKLVLCDLLFLSTLPTEVLSAGMAEVIKAGIIGDPSLINLLPEVSADIFKADSQSLEEVIAKAVRVKADIVSRDEKESHERMKLNFGHTIGHGLEISCKLSHGQAVACGMVLETKLAVRLGLCENSTLKALIKLCELFRLPVEIEFDVEDVFSRMLQDKKRKKEEMAFALPRDIGQVEIISINNNEIKKHLSNLRFS